MLANLVSNQSSNLLNSGLFGGNGGQQQGNQNSSQLGGSLLGNTLNNGLFGGNNNTNDQRPGASGLLNGSGVSGGTIISNPLFGGNNKGQQNGGGLVGTLGNNQGNSNQNLLGQGQLGGGFLGGLLGSNNQSQFNTGLFGNSGGNTQNGGTTTNQLLGGGSNTSMGLLGSNGVNGNTGSNNNGLMGGMGLLGGGLNSNNGGNDAQEYGTLKAGYKKTSGKEGNSILAISAMNEYKGKSLEELRLQDYKLIKNANSLPDNVKQILQSKMQGSNNSGVSGGLLSSNNQQNQQSNNGLLNQSSGLFNSQNQQSGGLLNSTNNQSLGLLGQNQAQQQQQNQQRGGVFNNAGLQQNAGPLNLSNNQQQNTNSSNGGQGLLASLQQPQGNNGNSNNRGGQGGLFQNQTGAQNTQNNITLNSGAGGLFQNLQNQSGAQQNQGALGGQGLLQLQQQQQQQLQQQGSINLSSGSNNMQQNQANLSNNIQAQSNLHLFADPSQISNFYNMQMQMMNQMMMNMMQNQINTPQPSNKVELNSNSNNSSNPEFAPPTDTMSYSLKSLGGKLSDNFRSHEFQKSSFSNWMKNNSRLYGRPANRGNSFLLKKKEALQLSQAPRNYSLIKHKAAYKTNSESLQFMFKRSDEDENYRGSNKSNTQSNHLKNRYSKQSVLSLDETINIKEIKEIYQNIEINVLFNDRHEFGRRDNSSYRIKLLKNSKIAELKKLAIQKIFGQRQNAAKDYTLIFRGVTLEEETSISDYNLKQNDTVELVMEASQKSPIIDISGKKVRKETLPPEELVPKLTKAGYKTEPSLTKMFRMNEEELSSIKNFTVYNEFGKITFEEPVDLRGVNLDQIITINHKSVEVYPENYENIPKLGEGLNKPATVVFYQWGIPQKYAGYFDEYQTKLRKWAGSIKAQLLYFKPEKQEVSIRVSTF